MSGSLSCPLASLSTEANRAWGSLKHLALDSIKLSLNAEVLPGARGDPGREDGHGRRKEEEVRPDDPAWLLPGDMLGELGIEAEECGPEDVSSVLMRPSFSILSPIIGDSHTVINPSCRRMELRY